MTHGHYVDRELEQLERDNERLRQEVRKQELRQENDRLRRELGLVGETEELDSLLKRLRTGSDTGQQHP